MDREVFICHAAADAAGAREICDSLEAAGIRCWIAPRDPLPGKPYGEQLVRAIEATPIVLLVLSAHSNESRAVLGEIELAANRGKVILPVRIADVQPSSNLEFYLRAIHWFDAASRPLQAALTDLVADVRRLLGPGVATTDEPAGAIGARRRGASNLPAQVSALIGRERDVADIEKLLDEHRLVTLVGSGGAGKTRAAIAVGEALLDRFADGVLLVELAAISDGSLIPTTIAQRLGVSESADRPLIETLVEYCRIRQTLLILDNCEHLVDDVRRVAEALLRGCPDVRILATSRQNLSIGGERIFRLPSLELPDAGAEFSANAALRFGAVALFADRAAAIQAGFCVDERNVGSVVEICRRLDGIPLAIELAAARIKVLSPQQLEQRLDERFRLLTGGDRSALPRHQTMRAAIDWSYDLLDEFERSLFRRLSIFADGFTLAGAAAACAEANCDEMTVLDTISSLLDKSLIQTDRSAGDRYRLLETTRQYGREKLAECGEAEDCARRHLTYVRDLFVCAADYGRPGTSAVTAQDLAVELENARAALDWGERHAVADAIDLFLAMRLWINLGLYREGIERAQRLLRLAHHDDSLRLANLWARSAFLAICMGHYAAALDASAQAVRYGRAANDPDTLAGSLITYADATAHARRLAEAHAALDEAERWASDSPKLKIRLLHARGLIASIQGDLETTARIFAETLDLYAATGNDAGVVSATINLAEAQHAAGATRKAIETAKRGITSAQRLANRSDWAFLTRNLSAYLNAVDDVPAAREAALAALSFEAAQDPAGPFAAAALEHFALSLAIEGDLRTAATLEGYAQKALERLGFEREYTERTAHERLQSVLTQGLAPDDLDELFARGEQMQATQALAITRLVATGPSA